MSANAHEMHHNISLIPYAACLGLSPVIWTKIHSRIMCRSLKSQQKPLKTLFLGFKVVHGHRCWYQKARPRYSLSSKSVSISNHSHA